MRLRFPGAGWISFLWGFAEATFFFFVPDVWLSRVVLTRGRAVLGSIALATAGAVLGGFVMYVFGAHGFAQAQAFLDAVPAIGGGMIADAGRQMQGGNAFAAMQAGSVSGGPYKIYAVWAGHLGLDPAQFALSSAAVRSLRFALVVAFAYIVGAALRRRLALRTVLRVHAVCWIAFYGYYFYALGF